MEIETEIEMEMEMEIETVEKTGGGKSTIDDLTLTWLPTSSQKLRHSDHFPGKGRFTIEQM
jgi:hypothetical protein